MGLRFGTLEKKETKLSRELPLSAECSIPTGKLGKLLRGLTWFPSLRNNLQQSVRQSRPLTHVRDIRSFLAHYLQAPKSC